MKMTVQQLIDELQKVEDKSKPVLIDDYEWGNRPVCEVIVDPYGHNGDIIIKSDL
ncbi:hypothetical protein CPT_Mater36 [Bacillus phage Mater]|uniref:Uncharacterized protein n=1 Tax=Bacillus phage Mater TaxID=1540090 RepID=A0A0A0RUF9_9CAUD|nr:hypothetical protein CPT_Mater36 [Bacillus phage Mater]AIW03193.1 hypothetical protein CPT_Mater36 [Bacillus phage Mater]